MIAFINLRPAICEADIKQFEEFIGWVLPSDYREFLLATNGGAPTQVNDSFTLPETCLASIGRRVVISTFFSLSGCDPACNLFFSLEEFVNLIPFEAIPIANDQFGNIISLYKDSGMLNVLILEQRWHLDYLAFFDADLSFTEMLKQLSEATRGK